jgi:hypothetical protein
MAFERQTDLSAGLCARCLHTQVVTSAHGSRFYLCRLSFTDPSFRKYPPIPVRSCPGFVEGTRSDPGGSALPGE